MPFKLWPAQMRIIWDMMITKLIITLKARQLGISWLACAYALWLCMFQRGKLVLIYSQGELEANELLRRVKVMYERLPDWLKENCPLAKEPNLSVIEWANGSKVQSLPSTKKAGRTFTASLVIMDEAAYMEYADGLFTAAEPTIDAGGQLIIISTANGIGNFFHKTWVLAVAGANSFKAIFLPWWERPGRDKAWYARQVAKATDPAKVKQEYPSSASEAFLVSGRTRFNPDWVDQQAQNIRPGLPVEMWPESLQDIQGLTIYSLPDEYRKTVMGADTAEGLEHGDYSTAVWIDSLTCEEIACLHGHWEPEEFGTLINRVSGAYLAVQDFGPHEVVERNNHGHAVLLQLRKLEDTRVVDGPDDRPGWLSNRQTKPLSIDALAIALKDGLATIHSAATIDEMKIYRVEPDGSTSAPPTYYDDRVMSWAIALGWLNAVGYQTSGWSANPLA